MRVELFHVTNSTSKCNSSELHFGVTEHFMGYSVAQRFSWSMIEPIHDEVKLIVGHSYSFVKLCLRSARLQPQPAPSNTHQNCTYDLNPRNTIGH